MKWAFNNERPIYAQIVEQIQHGILRGEYQAGSGMPSVRVLAMEAEVNPNTMQKALAELETQGLLHANRTAGRYVTEDKEMITKLKEKMAKRHILAFWEGMKELGIDGEEALKMLSSLLKEESKEVQ